MKNTQSIIKMFIFLTSSIDKEMINDLRFESHIYPNEMFIDQDDPTPQKKKEMLTLFIKETKKNVFH